MLTYLDVAIAFAAVMAAASLAVTAAVQVVTSGLGTRGATLHQALRILFETLGDKTPAETADKILKHPLVSDSIVNSSLLPHLGWWQRATAIRLEEFQVLSGLWVNATPEEAARLNTWFLAVTGRAAQRFALKTRLWSVFFALIVVGTLNLDSFALLNRLHKDVAARARIVAASDGTNSTGTDEAKAKPILEAAGLNVVNPTPELPRSPQAFFGHLLSIGLLALGSPFWFNLLKQLSSLRPLFASRIANSEARTAVLQ